MMKLLTCAAVVCLALGAQAQHPLVSSGKLIALPEITVSAESRVASCAPAAALRDLEWNNVNALIETGGTMWLDRAVGKSHYFVPKEGNVSVAYAGALWLGGISPDQQLKLAAVTYRGLGNDFWPGPLTNDGTAETNSSVCSDWDRFIISFRTDAQRHRAFFECESDPACDPSIQFPNGYSIPAYFFNYPAMGNTAQGQDMYLAPFYDFNEDGFYSPELGDYPWYDFLREINCGERRRKDPVPLFGDQTYFWIFNDKGNAHTESQGQPIGMEIRAQAFAFSTNDEVNNMTFYNYVLINQGTQTLQDTYFGTWIDCDIGGHLDDFVGCDVQRGLGYAYNGNAFDGPTGLSPGYGDNPPAMGVDFFEGPYQDSDGLDNPLTSDIPLAIELRGIPYKGIGIGYGDGVVDNERFGMRKFVFHNSGASPNGFPENAVQFYSFLRGFWKNGQRMAYGGNALTPSTGADLTIPSDFMFPGDSDPFNFGTLGIEVDPWTEVSSGNPAADRRFLQSAGPFTLQPGDYNNITVGVVWARATGGAPFESVELLRVADDKAQALFDNCFELISGPDAPDVEVREMSREIILYLSNDNALSSNYREEYEMVDPTIPPSNSNGVALTEAQRSYLFQGYLIYQLSGPNVSAADLEDISKARLIMQCDIEDGISDLINYTKDEETGLTVPRLMVSGADEGIRRSFRVTTDAFAQGNNRLVNHKTYYFMAIAYGYNEYEEFNISLGTGQDVTFLPSRKGVFSSIPVIAAIPQDVKPENGGTTANASYGTGVFLTRIEGKGNGLNDLIITAESENDILAN
ncbi:MAG: T9SS C-terminal target domain-containing protein, partial [Flavobacteriales bacterium]